MITFSELGIVCISDDKSNIVKCRKRLENLPVSPDSFADESTSMSLEVDKYDNILLSDWTNNKIEVLDRDLRLRGEIQLPNTHDEDTEVSHTYLDKENGLHLHLVCG